MRVSIGHALNGGFTSTPKEMRCNPVPDPLGNYSNAPRQYDEPEGIFPDGEHTLVECDRQQWTCQRVLRLGG